MVLMRHSVLDKEHQYFIAESTKSLDISDSKKFQDSGDGLWIGCSRVRKEGRLCEVYSGCCVSSAKTLLKSHRKHSNSSLFLVNSPASSSLIFPRTHDSTNSHSSLAHLSLDIMLVLPSQPRMGSTSGVFLFLTL